MLSVLLLLGVFALPFVGASVASPNRTLTHTPTSVVMAALFAWLLLLWSLALALAWPALTTVLRVLPF